jgi:tol-pal system protein YbgF
MMRVFPILLAGFLCLPTLAPAQDRAATLADIRQEMSVLFVQIQTLRRELSTTQGAASAGFGGSVLERVDAIEGALTSLTARTEELEFSIERIVTDGTNRIGDLEFRLVELEGGDLGGLGNTPRLGGDTGITAVAQAPLGGAAEGPQLATAEQGAFDAARAAFDTGRFADAAPLFAGFVQNFPGGPLSNEASFMLGESYRNLGSASDAARAYLDTFTADPSGIRAAASLLQLGGSLGDLGQTAEACVMYEELVIRFPQSGEASAASSSASTLNCF